MENIERFESLLTKAMGNRDGFDGLLEFIRKSDFYTAPASTRFHSCHEGGLLEHSLNVCDRLMHNCACDDLGSFLKVKEENMIVASLLHDLCKSYYYVVDYKNQKTYDEETVAKADKKSVKQDNKGYFVWETVPIYKVDDKIPYGHGEKSVMMIEEFVRLEPVERYAIRWHMGFTEPKENWNYVSAAFTKYPLCLALHVADLEATYLVEEEK